MSTGRRLISWLICFTALGSLLAHSSYSQEHKPNAIQLGTNIVSVPVSVLDRSGRYVASLNAENFEIYDDGIKQKIEFFTQEDAPLVIGVIYDLSESMLPRRERALAAMEKFLRRIRPRDEFFAVGISNQPVLLKDFTRDPKALTNRIAFLAAEGRTALFDGIYLGLEKIRQSPAPRRILLIISDGQDNHSRYRYRELRRYVSETDVQLFAIGLPSLWGYNDELELQGRRVLRDLTALTGGEVFFARDESEVVEAFDRIDELMRRQYSLAFNAPATRAERRWHKLKVRLVKLDPPEANTLAVRARAGYWAGQ